MVAKIDAILILPIDKKMPCRWPAFSKQLACTVLLFPDVVAPRASASKPLWRARSGTIVYLDFAPNFCETAGFRHLLPLDSTNSRTFCESKRKWNVIVYVGAVFSTGGRLDKLLQFGTFRSLRVGSLNRAPVLPLDRACSDFANIDKISN